MNKLFIMTVLLLAGCGHTTFKDYEDRIVELENKIETLEQNEQELLEETTESISREEATDIIRKYLKDYKFNEHIGQYEVTNEAGNDGKMDFVSVRIIAQDPKLETISDGFGYDAETIQSIYTEMMYYANDLLKELEGVVPQYTQNLSVSFSGQYDLNYKQYPMPIAYVGRIEGEKKVIHTLDYSFNYQFGYLPELIEVEDLDK